MGIAARLLGIALVPTIGLTVVTGKEIAEDQRLARDAGTFAERVDAAAVALDAFLVATQEFRLVETVAGATSFGISVEVAGDLLGMDIPAAFDRVRPQLDENPLIPGFLAELDAEDALPRARAAIDRGDDSEADQALFSSLVEASRDLWERRLERITAEDAGGVSLRDDLRRALIAFEASADIFQLANDQLLLVSELTVPGSATRLRPDDTLEMITARYEAAVERLVEDASPALAPLARAVAADDTFARAMAAMPIGATDSFDVRALGALFRAGIERFVDLQEVIEQASAEATSVALAVRSEAEGEYRRTVALLVALVAGTMALALVGARSIVRPLWQLERRAAALSDGELDGDPLPLTGPREAAVLSGTLNEAVANLRVVERQVRALAAGDLEAARELTAPGTLGALVGASVDALAGSIAEQDRLQRRLAHEASHDALTGLPSRRTAMARLGELLDDPAAAALYVDLDGFKSINDDYGHAVGDALLIVVSERLTRCVPDGSLVARLGGDEFVVGVAGAVDAVALAAEIATCLSEPFSIDARVHRIAASVGVAFARPDDDADHFLRSADAALYEAKRRGRGLVVVLDDELRARLDDERRVEADLRVAIAADALELHYQPIVEAATGALTGVEALVRWRLDDGTLVPPDRFIGAAERSGLIAELDRWVLHHALGQVAAWRMGPFPDLRVSVNVAAPTLLSPDFVADVGIALSAAGLPGDALLLEVTETALVDDLDAAADRVAALATMGVRASIDDFGTGYTSVSHLRRLAVAEVKIDRSFVHGMASDERDAVLVDVVLRIATALRIDVVAEGVETPEQLAALTELGCRYVQGYLIGRPAPAAEFEAAVAARS